VAETATGNTATIVLTAQPIEGGQAPIILDIAAARSQAIDPANWDEIVKVIRSLRELKNLVFFSSLTDRSLELFRAARH